MLGSFALILMVGVPSPIADCRLVDEVHTSSRAAQHRWLGRDALFRPLVAHPREPRLGLGIGLDRGLGVPGPVRATGLVSAGGAWSIFGSRPRDGCDGFMVGIDGVILAQFDLSQASRGLVNADYVVGLPVTWRQGAWSGRVRLLHQSSHLGDEFLLANPEVARQNLSFELLEALFAVDLGPWRTYFGAGMFLRSLPSFERLLLHWGLELRTRAWWDGGPNAFQLRGVGAADFEMLQARDWDIAISGKGGIELSRVDFGVWRLLLVGYRGLAPYGQFFRERPVSSFGVEAVYLF